jgi:hypothetical protein
MEGVGERVMVATTVTPPLSCGSGNARQKQDRRGIAGIYTASTL